MNTIKIVTLMAFLVCGVMAQSKTNDSKSAKTKPLVIKTVASNAVGYTTFRSTAYCLRGKTSIGILAKKGIIAVDPKVISLRSRVEIVGLGVFLAADTGRLIKGNIVDIHMSCSDAARWGRRTIKLKRL